MLVVQAERTFCSRWSFDLLAWNVPCEWQDTKGRRLSLSATSASMCEGLLSFSVACYFPKACFLHAATKRSITVVKRTFLISAHFVRGDRSIYSRGTSIASDKTQKDGVFRRLPLQLACVRARWASLSLATSQKLVSCMWQRLLHYGHTYQLNDRANVETMNAHTRAYYGTSERCENGSVFTLERS